VPLVTDVVCWPSNIIRAVPGDAGHGDAAGASGVNPPPQLQKHAKVQCVSSNPCTPQHGIMEHSDIHLVHCGGYHMDQVSLTLAAVLFVKVEPFVMVRAPLLLMAPPLVQCSFK
jgi:hypothetical protein